MSVPDCYLNNLALDMVTEIDHINNYCLCSKCTCGRHICPKPRGKMYPKSTFNSYYKLNYKRHSLSQKPSFSATPHRKSIFKLESETTTSHDYKAYPQDSSCNISTPKHPNESLNKYRLSSCSTYRQDFTNWGSMKTESTKFTRTNVGTGVKFNATSTYASCYQNSPTAPSKIVKPTANTNILCTGNVVKTPETTMKSSYSKYRCIPSQPIHRGDNTVPLPAFPNQYATINSINYDSKDIGVTIRRVRKTFE